jgi:hypothetical protein
VTTEIGEASPFHWRQQVQLGNRQAVKQSGDSRCNGHGHVRLPWKSRYIIGLSPLHQGLIRSSIGVRVEPAYSALVLTPRQLRAARVLIGWSRKVLSERSGVPIKTTEAFERGTTDPKMSTEHKWRRALERAGVVFIEEDETGGVGVRLRERRKGDSAP